MFDECLAGVLLRKMQRCLCYFFVCWSYLFRWILSPIDVTLYSLGVFDCISRACWSKSMCGERTVSERLMYCIDELLNWQYEHRDHQQATKRNLTPRICIYFKTSRGNRLLIHGELCQRTLKQDVLKQRPSSLASKNICVDCLAIVRLKLTNNRRPKHSLWLNKRYIWNSRTKIVNRSTQQRYRRFYQQNKSISTVVQLSRPCWTDRSRAFGSLIT